jgi:hypothetical protein
MLLTAGNVPVDLFQVCERVADHAYSIHLVFLRGYKGSLGRAFHRSRYDWPVPLDSAAH